MGLSVSKNLAGVKQIGIKRVSLAYKFLPETDIMKFTAIGLSALTLGLAACGSSEQPAQNDQAAVESGSMDADMAMDESGGPFAEAESSMDQRMMAAMGSDAGQNWAKKMIEHHQGAINMSQVVLQQNPQADVAKMAREAIAKNQKDSADIRKLLNDGAADQASADLYRPAMMDMKQKMMAAAGADVSETFMRKMVAHHNGAVAMSDIALKNGVTGPLRAQVQKTRDKNKKDAQMTEAMLRGEPMSGMEKTPATTKSAPVPVRPEGQSSNKASPAAKEKTTPEPGMEGHDMKDM